MWKNLSGTAICIIIAGCANSNGYVQMYKGAALPPTQKSTIQGSNNYRRGTLANEMIRIVAVDGVDVPRQWGVGEGANSVALLPGFHIVKIFYVHGSPEGIDYYTYDSVPIQAVANCTYQIVAYTSSKNNAMGFSFIGYSSSQANDQDCGQGVVDLEKNKPISI
ncbi:hypothetical protein [Alkanindiges illinoisensis]|uniref:hypothetical protein n=1 Tax=Alkanindiges illinoisensis TaxID=197183 RepID=UPI00047B8814|nr:hypothetical protein [Alkanindiges illinoisensis]